MMDRENLGCYPKKDLYIPPYEQHHMPLFSVKCRGCGYLFDYDSAKNATRVWFCKETNAPTIYYIPCPECGEINDIEYRDPNSSR